MWRVLPVGGGVVLLLGVLTSFGHPWVTLQGAFSGPFHQSFETEAVELCTVEDPELNEASGLAMSLHHQDAVWIHNDSGDTARLFLVGLDGKTQAVVRLSQDRPTDWEDMCSFEIDGQAWLLIGDTGDNSRIRGTSAPACQLLLVKEPKLPKSADKAAPAMIKADVHATLQFSFPDGPADCESLAVDTQRREILLLTKTDPTNCRLYRLPLKLEAGKTTSQAELLASVPVPYATAMDVSRDNRQLAIVNMFSGVILDRQPDETWTSACAKPVTILTLPVRPQGETVCFERDGKSLLLNSEKASQPLWRVTLPETATKAE